MRLTFRCFYSRFVPAAAAIFIFFITYANSSETSNTKPTGNANESKQTRQDLIEREPGIEPVFSTPPVRRLQSAVSQSASPYILLHTGAREFDNNGNWKRHIVNDPGGNVHMTFGIFDNAVGRNNVYVYQCYNPLTGALTFPVGSEPGPPASIGGTCQNGGIDITPQGKRAVIVGRSTLRGGSNQGSAVIYDAGSCLGQLAADTMAGPSAPLFLDPDIHIINETTWVGFLTSFNFENIQTTRTSNGGKDWSAPVPLFHPSFLSVTHAGKKDYDGNPNNDTIWAAAQGCLDSNCFGTSEEILVTRSTDGGQSWEFPPVSATGPFESPGYRVLYNGGITAIMIGDTFHIAWLDWADTSIIFPGGHVHHLAIAPNGVVDGPHKVADINLFFDQTRDNSAAAGGAFGLGGGFGIWQHPTLAYRPGGLLPSPSHQPALYCLWSQPPENNRGGYVDSTIDTTGRIYPVADIFCSASPDNGRSWDFKTNVTQTIHPNCDIDPNTPEPPCESEYYISAAKDADSLIYIVAQVQSLPGFQSGVSLDQYFIGVDATGTNVRLLDEWRLYKIPARLPGEGTSCSSQTDTIPPKIFCPTSETSAILHCLGGINKTYRVGVVDNCPGTVAICDPPSGSFFPVGITSVTCIATDSAGFSDTCNFPVIISQFDNPPAITCPQNLTVNNDPNVCSSAVNYSLPTVADECPGSIGLTCVPGPGANFPVGQTTVKCIATDSTGNKDSCQFLVTVKDTSAPTLSCPTNIAVVGDSGICGAKEKLFVEAYDNCPLFFINCTPSVGSILPIGTTTILCGVRDIPGNFDTCSFSVTVYVVKGDLNRDSVLTTSDVVLELNCVFLGMGNCGNCFADVNCDGILTASDVILHLNAAFLNMPLPCT